MKSRDFCYWLMGSIELGKLNELDKEQTQTLKNHLNMVFKHEIDNEGNIIVGSLPQPDTMLFNDNNSNELMRC